MSVLLGRDLYREEEKGSGPSKGLMVVTRSKARSGAVTSDSMEATSSDVEAISSDASGSVSEVVGEKHSESEDVVEVLAGDDRPESMDGEDGEMMHELVDNEEGLMDGEDEGGVPELMDGEIETEVIDGEDREEIPELFDDEEVPCLEGGEPEEGEPSLSGGLTANVLNATPEEVKEWQQADEGLSRIRELAKGDAMKDSGAHATFYYREGLLYRN